MKIHAFLMHLHLNSPEKQKKINLVTTFQKKKSKLKYKKHNSSQKKLHIFDPKN